MITSIREFYENAYKSAYHRAQKLGTNLLFKKVTNWTHDISPMTQNQNEEFRAYMETLCQRKDLTPKQKDELHFFISQGADGVADIVNNYYLRLLNHTPLIKPIETDNPRYKEFWSNVTNTQESNKNTHNTTMFFKTINEWRQNVKNAKAINEGPGSGISFVTETNVYYKGILTKDSIEILEATVNGNSFSAKGYDDGMSDISPDLIKWVPVTLTREMILGIKLSEETDTVEKILNDPETASISFQIEVLFDYNNMHFGGYSRGTFEVNDIVFDQSLNRNSEFSYMDNNIDLTVNLTDGQNILDIDSNNDGTFEKVAPVGRATEQFTYFYKDVFQYSSSEEGQSLAYNELLDTDVYDETLAEFMEQNGIEMTIDAYKESLKNESGKLPKDLYHFLDENQKIEEKADEMHWEDCKANYGI